MTHRLPDAFSKNRSEESREDNWEEFVVPPFLHSLGIKSQSKAIVIIGGRGCGKTTLLRYFCHATQFSIRRQKLPTDAISHIGLYWRADTNFLNSFSGGGQSAETWRAAFEHLLACELGDEILQSLHNLNKNPERIGQYGGTQHLDFSTLLDFDDALGTTISDLKQSLQRGRRVLSMWINNLDSRPQPAFLPADLFLRALINCIQEQLPTLAESTYAVFIDEYENMRDDQQRFINGLLKHGSSPLLYNIAMKRNGWLTKNTLGTESLQDISDYREVDIELSLATNFDVFAAEILLFRLAVAAPNLAEALPISPTLLHSVDKVSERYNDKDYRNRVLKAANTILPRINERAAAVDVLADPRLREKLTSRIRNALQKREQEIPPDNFIDDSFPEASLLMSALLSRPRETPENILSEFKALKNGRDNRLSASGDLVANNLFGCVNSIYIDAGRPSILFSGFSALTLIAKENIRHLLELIHRIFKAYEEGRGNELPVVPAEVQATAVREASEQILNTVDGHGTNGPQLYSLAQCLGSIFRERHKSEKQSEPEVNQFTIGGGELHPKFQKYLSDAEKWSVLFVSRETKMKATGSISSDYTLNPIFSPYFQISFRKKRSVQLSTAQLLIMLESDQQARDSLVRVIGRPDAAENSHPDLFDEPIV